MKKIIYLILILLIVSGCNFIKGGGKKGDLPDYQKIYSGSDGLVMKFLPNAPADQVIANTYMPIGIYFENKGAKDISNAIIMLTYTEDTIEADKTRFNLDIEGKETIYLQGGRSTEIIDAQVNDVTKIGTEKPTTRITATSCYDYETKLSAPICVNTDPYGVESLAGKKQACEPKTQTYSNQGAPVAITKIEQLTVPKNGEATIIIKAYIANKNNGIIYKKGTNYCEKQKQELNTINARAVLLGRDVICDPAEFKLSERNDENFVTCTFTGISTSDAFTTELQIIAEYGYSSTIYKDITIERATIADGCIKCTGEGYIAQKGAGRCQPTSDGNYITAIHQKCVRGCVEEYPDFTTSPPTQC